MSVTALVSVLSGAHVRGHQAIDVGGEQFVDVEDLHELLHNTLDHLLQLKQKLQTRLLVNVLALHLRLNLQLVDDGNAIVLVQLANSLLGTGEREKNSDVGGGYRLCGLDESLPVGGIDDGGFDLRHGIIVKINYNTQEIKPPAPAGPCKAFLIDDAAPVFTDALSTSALNFFTIGAFDRDLDSLSSLSRTDLRSSLSGEPFFVPPFVVWRLSLLPPSEGSAVLPDS